MQRALRHFASLSFWDYHDNLPDEIEEIADKNLSCLKKTQNIRLYISRRLKTSGRSE